MVCERITIDGVTAIVCGRFRRAPKCKCGSRLPATLLCDWKVKARKSGTCDAKICKACAKSPAPEKDLCPDHWTLWEAKGETEVGNVLD